ncbi:MAG TPA: ABC transporter permease subunit [Dehalococcoidia bacterium]|nr:ABC transporter permease subunit [Dehalococcoidia bacterium]
MPPLNVFAKSLRDQKWQIAGFGLALAAMSSTSVWLWPSVRDSLQNFEIPAAARAFLGSDLDFATGAGYLSGRYFGWTEILAIVYVIIAGTGAIAGEESASTIDLLLAQPVSRRAVLLQKLAATALGAALIIFGGYVGFLVSVPTVDMEVPLSDLAVGCANMVPIVLFFFALSLWAGAVAPNRGIAAGFVIGITTATYFVFTLANGVESLEPIRYATPFYYYGAGRPLVYGVTWWHVGLLLGTSAVLVALTLRTFERRDVSAGGATDLGLGSVLRRIAALRTGV